MLKAAIKLRTSMMAHLKTAESKCEFYADDDVENLRYALDKLADVIEALELVEDNSPVYDTEATLRAAGFEPAVTKEQAAEYNQMLADQELEENLLAALPDTTDFDSEW